MPTFPGAKILTLGPVHKNIGRTITHLRVTIPSSVIIGSSPEIRVKTSSAGTWESISNGVTKLLDGPGLEVYVRVIKSGGKICCKLTDSSVVPGIIVKVINSS